MNRGEPRAGRADPNIEPRRVGGANRDVHSIIAATLIAKAWVHRCNAPIHHNSYGNNFLRPYQLKSQESAF